MAQLTIEGPLGSSCRARPRRGVLWCGGRVAVSGEESRVWQAQVPTSVSEEGFGGSIWWSLVWGRCGTRMGESGVGRRRWAGPRGLYGTGLQHHARHRAGTLDGLGEYIAHGRTHGAEGTAGFSSHDGREAWHWEQLRGRGACLEEPTLLWACVPGLLRAGVAVSISRTAIGCKPVWQRALSKTVVKLVVCPGQHVEMMQR